MKPPSAWTWSYVLKCGPGSIPSPRENHAAVLVDDVMYVFGGDSGAVDGAHLGDLAAFNLSSKWFGIFNLMRSFK